MRWRALAAPLTDLRLVARTRRRSSVVAWPGMSAGRPLENDPTICMHARIPHSLTSVHQSLLGHPYCRVNSNQFSTQATRPPCSRSCVNPQPAIVHYASILMCLSEICTRIHTRKLTVVVSDLHRLASPGAGHTGTIVTVPFRTCRCLLLTRQRLATLRCISLQAVRQE